MRAFFMALVLANLAAFAWQHGVFGRMVEPGREPDRVNRQVEADRIRVLTPAQVQDLREKARPQPADGPLAGLDLAAGKGCVDFGDFNAETAARVRLRLEALNLAERLTSSAVEVPGWYMVYVPPFKTRAEVERAAAEIRKLGVKDMLVIADNSPLRFGIALGSFRDPELAQKHQADLARRGVQGVRVSDVPSSVPGTRFRITGVDAETAAGLTLLHREFQPSRLAPCSGG
jgi:hypothetical protein